MDLIIPRKELLFSLEELTVYWRIGHYYICHRRHCDPKDYPAIGKLHSIINDGRQKSYQIVYSSSNFIGVRPFALKASGLWASSIQGRDSTYDIQGTYYTEENSQQQTFILLTTSLDEPTEDWPALYSLKEIVDAKPQIGIRAIRAMITYVCLNNK